jgi:ribokinase
VIARDVIVVGDVILDVVAKPLTDIAPTSDTRSRIRMSRGGAAANTAAALALTGHNVTFLGASGVDLAAKLFEDTLRGAGIEAALERVNAATGIVVAVVSPEGQRAMLTDRGASSMLGLEHVLRRLERPFDHLHVSGYTLLDPLTVHVGRAALARALELGRSTSVDVCSVAPLIEMTSPAFLEASRGVRFLFANEEEALVLSESADITTAIDILSRAFDEVVVTRGEKGARARSDGVNYEVASLSDVVFDTTGAGDAAAGAYLGARLDGALPLDALTLAMAASARVVGDLGSSEN